MSKTFWHLTAFKSSCLTLVSVKAKRTTRKEGSLLWPNQDYFQKNQTVRAIRGPELLVSQAFDDFFAVSVCVYFYNIFVQSQQTAVEHDHAAIDDDGPYIIGFCGVNEMRIVIVKRRLIKIVPIDNIDVGTFSDLKRADKIFHV